ncbi:MAG: hypothetical protein ACYDCO_14135 [Armatimonadota bacterium]
MRSTSIDPGFAYYYRPVRNTASVIVIFGVLVSIMFFSGFEEFDRLGEYLSGRTRPPTILFAPLIFILIHTAVAMLVHWMGTRHLRAASRVLATARPRSARIAVRSERWPCMERTISRWYVDLEPGETAGDLPATIRIAPPPGSEPHFNGLREEVQVYFDGNPDNLVIHTSRGLLLAMKRDDVSYP